MPWPHQKQRSKRAVGGEVSSDATARRARTAQEYIRKRLERLAEVESSEAEGHSESLVRAFGRRSAASESPGRPQAVLWHRA